MSSNIRIFNAAVRHQVYLKRYATGQAKQLQRDLVAIKRTVIKELIGNDNIRSREHRTAFLRQINRVLAEGFDDSSKQLTEALKALGTYEAEFHKRLIQSAIGVELVGVTEKEISKAVFKKAFAFSATEHMDIASALQAFGRAKSKQILNVVRDGLTQGEDIPTTTRAINEVINTRALFQAETLARTLIQQVTTASREELYANNSDVIAKLEWVSVLDDRTTDGCLELDGQTWEEDESHPEPGYHWNCRSILVPVVDPKYNLADGAKVTRAAREEDGKTVHIDGRATAESWLKERTDEFQDRTLGTTKGELFRNGVELKKMVDDDYHPLTVADLRASDDSVIQKAFEVIDSNK